MDKAKLVLGFIRKGYSNGLQLPLPSIRQLKTQGQSLQNSLGLSNPIFIFSSQFWVFMEVSSNFDLSFYGFCVSFCGGYSVFHFDHRLLIELSEGSVDGYFLVQFPVQ
ncbi:hypothetical protein H5410_005773 [Solanum commersonii]|uniref:Uncharacterized protein n=1 Tax=Solanum commersonii TaxID=4109 RepID=A0A9J6A8E7_SOLCO|nr:hypothetical protein H5410_005773 [Solanum commersonii]